MRNICKMVLLGAGIVLSLAGCQKGTTPASLTGKAVRFSAVAGSVNTRTAFSGEGTQDENKTDKFGRKLLTWERIDWTVGDAVMIASDNATVYQDPNNTHYATYTIASVTPNDNISEAELDEKAADEELFFNENTSYAFWGVYPAPTYSGAGTDLEGAKTSYTISKSQKKYGNATTTTAEVDGKTLTLTTLAPDMSQAVMLAAAENQTAQDVELKFYPGFTAFEFTLNAKDENDLPLKELILRPADETKSLAGDVVASIKAGELASTFKNTYPGTTAEANAITFTFPDNTAISDTKYLTFTVLALPEDIEGMYLEFHMGEEGDVIQKARLLKEGENIKFDKCKKYCLRGIAVEGGWNFSLINVKLQVLDWDAVDGSGDSQALPQATQFSISGAQNGDTDLHIGGPITDDNRQKDPYRQQWFFQPGQKVRVTFKVMLPAGGSWEVVPVGGTTFLNNNGKVEEKLIEGDEAYFTIKNVSPDIDEDTPTVTTNLWGNMKSAGSTNVELEITYNGTDTAEHCFFFKSYVYTGPGKTGTKFSIDSETQIYDRGRGFHTFIVNCPAPAAHPHSN